MKELKEFVSERLLEQKAVKLQPNNPFVWANGWQCPIYFDSRKLLSYPRSRCMLKLEMSRVVLEHFQDVEVIAAVAPNAIAVGVMVAEELGLPFVYVNPMPKDHGFENSIEGELKPRQKVVIIDDQLSVGCKCTRVQEILERDGSKVIGLVAIFDYNLAEGKKRLADNGLKHYALTNFSNLIRNAALDGKLSADGEKELLKWQSNPAEWKVEK